MTIAQFLAPYSQELFDRTFVIFKSQGWVKDVELDFVRKDGSVLPVSVTAAAVMSPYGEFIMSRSTVSEITERKQAETELQARQEELIGGQCCAGQSGKAQGRISGQHEP
ncbi:MAG: PAS domain-containing protein [Anaerolineales bacterium]|nr:PAS domain-containing protein [Anaerolineales bacterium]